MHVTLTKYKLCTIMDILINMEGYYATNNSLVYTFCDKLTFENSSDVQSQIFRKARNYGNKVDYVHKVYF